MPDVIKWTRVEDRNDKTRMGFYYDLKVYPSDLLLNSQLVCV